MPIITLDEVKGFTKLTNDNTYDEQIELLIPVVQDLVVYSICQNRFEHPSVYIQANTISFDATNDKILDSDSNFLENDFAVGDIMVQNSLYNDGIYEINSISEGEMVVTFEHSNRNELIDESAGESVHIHRMNFPVGIKLPTAMLIYWLLNLDNWKGIKSESILTYSVQYVNEMPKNLKDMFKSWRKLKW